MADAEEENRTLLSEVPAGTTGFAMPIVTFPEGRGNQAQELVGTEVVDPELCTRSAPRSS